MLNDVELFTRIIEAGSLSQAARQLGLSKAVASKRLSRLEAQLGTRLIARTTRRLAPTAEGNLLYERAAAALEILRGAEVAIASIASIAEGRLRVSAPTSFGRLHVAPHLQPFLDANPRLELELDLSDGLVDLVAEPFDVAVRIGPPPSSTFQSRLLAPNTRVLCAAPGYLAHHGTPEGLPELERHRLLAAVGQLPWRLDGPQGAALVRGNSFVRTNSSEVARELALAGTGIALRSIWDVHRELASGALVRVLPGYAGSAEVAIYAVYPRSDFTPNKVLKFIEYLAELYSPTPPWARQTGKPT